MDLNIEFALKQIEELENILQNASKQLTELKQCLLAQTTVAVKEEIPTPVFEPVSASSTPVSSIFLGDKITKTFYADLTKSLTLNDRFRFLRDLFEGNVDSMDKTLEVLNNLSSLQESIDYLCFHFAWNWEAESVIAFKTILEKRFN